MTATRKRVPRQERERQMLAAGVRFFGEHGYASTSMDEIATEVGVTKPMLYAYFGSKQGLYEACLEHAGSNLIERLDSAVDAAGPPAEQVRAGIRAMFEFVEDSPGGWRLLHHNRRDGASPNQELFERERMRIAANLSQLLADAAVEAGLGETVISTIEPFAHGVIGAAEALADLWMRRGGGRAFYELTLMNLIWQGLGRIIRGELWEGETASPAGL